MRVARSVEKYLPGKGAKRREMRLSWADALRVFFRVPSQAIREENIYG